MIEITYAIVISFVGMGAAYYKIGRAHVRTPVTA